MISARCSRRASSQSTGSAQDPDALPAGRTRRAVRAAPEAAASDAASPSARGMRHPVEAGHDIVKQPARARVPMKPSLGGRSKMKIRHGSPLDVCSPRFIDGAQEGAARLARGRAGPRRPAGPWRSPAVLRQADRDPGRDNVKVMAMPPRPASTPRRGSCPWPARARTEGQGLATPHLMISSGGTRPGAAPCGPGDKSGGSRGPASRRQHPRLAGLHGRRCAGRAERAALNERRPPQARDDVEAARSRERCVPEGCPELSFARHLPGQGAENGTRPAGVT
jgi:hypothetical protein